MDAGHLAKALLSKNDRIQLIVDGGLEFKANVNSKFPDIKPVSVEEYLTKYWKGV